MPPVELPLEVLGQRLAPVGVEELARLTGGASSLTYTGTTADGSQVVVKVAPAGVPPVLNRDVLRQARVLRALADTPVPVPRVLWEDVGEPPDVPPLFVMSFVAGTSVEPLFDVGDDDDVATSAERMRNAARLMAALHSLDPYDLGLGQEPVVGPAAEVERWSRLLQTVDPRLSAGWEDVAAALHAGEPRALSLAIVHGDFRLGNLLAVGSDIAAVIDWEIWTVGDARVDLAWFLVHADPETYRRRTAYAGALPSPAELAAMYGEMPDLPWFEALACFKSAASWSLIVKHDRRRAEPDPDVQAMATVLPHLLDQARARLA